MKLIETLTIERAQQLLGRKPLPKPGQKVFLNQVGEFSYYVGCFSDFIFYSAKKKTGKKAA